MQSFQRFPHSLTTVTTFSKFIALILFICLPFFGFALGMNYQQKVDVQNQQSKQMIVPKPTTSPTANWKMFRDNTLGFSISYPADWTLKRFPSSSYPGIELSPSAPPCPSGTFLTKCFQPEKILITVILSKQELNEYLRQNNKVTYTSVKIDNVEGFETDQLSIVNGGDDIFVEMDHRIYQLTLQKNEEGKTIPIDKSLFHEIVNTFKLLDQTAAVTPTCMPKPACLDANPRCMIAEPAQGWCSTSSTAQLGEHCGGNMSTAKQCATGTHCAPDPNSHLPFGDVGGTCVKN